MGLSIYKCDVCGEIVMMLKKGGCTPSCCGRAMTELSANTSDGAKEKHVPDVSVSGDVLRVKVGSVEHPMTEEHLIQWIALETAKGAQRKVLKAGDAPKAEFALTDDDSVVAVYAYCNLHGLWKAE